VRIYAAQQRASLLDHLTGVVGVREDRQIEGLCTVRATE
jgi:hypothetical protein